MGLSGYLMLAAALFSIGLYGMLTRRNVIAVLASIELMANAANINLAAFSRFRGEGTGQVFVLFSTAITVAEVVVGLSLVILLFRSRGNVLLENASDLKG